MSLVAYGSSDESESSDIEENVENKLETAKTKFDHETLPSDSVAETDTGLSHLQSLSFSADQGSADPHISDEEDDFLIPTDGDRHGLKLPPPKHSDDSQRDTITKFPGIEIERKQKDESSFLLELPAPKEASLSKPSTSPNDLTDELEEMVKPKEAELAIREKLPSKKKKHVIKIAVPSLADYDSDEDEPRKKKSKPSETGSGLFALLPKPKNFSLKVAGRALIPHTLTKKTVPSKPVRPVLKTDSVKETDPQSCSKQDTLSHSNIVAMDDDDSDAEDDNGSLSTNFFSIGTEKGDAKAKSKTLLSTSSFTVNTSSSTLPQVPTPESKQDRLGATNSVSENDSDPDNSPSSEGPQIFNPALQDAPLQFKTSSIPLYSSAGSYPLTQGSETSHYPEPYSSEQLSGEDEGEENYPSAEDTEIPPEDLLRLQGKRHWGRETVNIIDFRADDHTSTADLTKNLTEEVDMLSHSKKKEGASVQQKRKHQITYLAQKAKEREFDLKNQWAQNRMTKQQTQSKYGF